MMFLFLLPTWKFGDAFRFPRRGRVNVSTFSLITTYLTHFRNIQYFTPLPCAQNFLCLGGAPKFVFLLGVGFFFIVNYAILKSESI